MGANAEVSAHVGNTLLPLYAGVLQDIDNKKEHELIDSVCFICDCMENGDDALFNKIVGHAGPVLTKIIHKAAEDKEDLRYDLMYSSIFGLGVIAKRITNG